MIPEFKKIELENTSFFPNVGEYYGYGKDYLPPFPKYSSPISYKENFKQFVSRKNPHWIPGLMSDVNLICPDVVPDFIACGLQGGIDCFGVTWIPTRPLEYMPAFVKPGDELMPDIEKWREVLKFPDVDAWDWKASGELYRAGLDRDRANCAVLLSTFFERLISLMGFENAAMSLLTDIDEVQELMENFADVNIRIMEHYKEEYDIDALIFHDDWGAQRGPFFSKSTLSTCILPAYSRFIARGHELGIFMIHHCCGNAECFVENMIECGADAWQVQTNANPHIMDTIKKYGDRIMFDPYGGFLAADLTDPVEAKQQSELLYQQMTKGKNVFYSVCSEDYLSPIDFNAICYEAGRKICTGELK